MLSGHPPNLSGRERYINCHTSQNINPEKGQHPRSEIIELKGNPFLSITRKRFGQYTVYIYYFSFFHSLENLICLTLLFNFLCSPLTFSFLLFFLLPSPIFLSSPFLSSHCSYVLHTNHSQSSLLYQLYTLLPLSLSLCNL
jgi:hypothetical protein